MKAMQAVATLPETIILRPPINVEMDAVQWVWSVSQDADEPLGRPSGGWWSTTNGATTSRVLVAAGAVVGLAAVNYRPGAEAAEAWVALLSAHRRRLDRPRRGWRSYRPAGPVPVGRLCNDQRRHYLGAARRGAPLDSTACLSWSCETYPYPHSTPGYTL